VKLISDNNVMYIYVYIRVDNSVIFFSFFFWHIFISNHIAGANNAHNLMANCGLTKKLFIENLGVDSDQCTE